jgi:hypothetical protein
MLWVREYQMMLYVSRTCVLSILLNCCGACSLLAADRIKPDANPQLDDPVRALANIPAMAREIKFQTGETVFPNGGHFQGIQAYYDKSLDKQVCFVSHDSETKGYFITVAFDPGPSGLGIIRHFQDLPSDGRQPPLRHAGGMQLIGDYLAVGVEDNQDKRRSQVQFWDVSDPFSPQLRSPLTVVREGGTAKNQTAGAVGIVRRVDDHLLVVANWDAEALDFYTSNGRPLRDDDCRFVFAARWSRDRAIKSDWEPDRNWGSYQSVNLVCDREFNVFLLGFSTDNVGRDFIDLYAVDLSRDPTAMIRKLSNKQMFFRGGAHFRNAGGIHVISATELSCYATERNDHGMTSINVSP